MYNVYFIKIKVSSSALTTNLAPTGAIPKELGELKDLQQLDLSKNQLSGKNYVRGFSWKHTTLPSR